MYGRWRLQLAALGVDSGAISSILAALGVRQLAELEALLGADNPALADLQRLFALVEGYGYGDWIEFDASIVRGLAYYTGEPLMQSHGHCETSYGILLLPHRRSFERGVCTDGGACDLCRHCVLKALTARGSCELSVAEVDTTACCPHLAEKTYHAPALALVMLSLWSCSKIKASCRPRLTRCTPFEHVQNQTYHPSRQQ